MGNSQCCENNRNRSSNRGPIQDATSQEKKVKPIPPGFTLLHGCVTMEQHEERVLADLQTVGFCEKRLRGEEGLRAIGFEFRFVPCAKHVASDVHQDNMSSDETSNDVDNGSPTEELLRLENIRKEERALTEICTENKVGWHSCKDCVTRLFFVGRPLADSTGTDSIGSNTDAENDINGNINLQISDCKQDEREEISDTVVKSSVNENSNNCKNASASESGDIKNNMATVAQNSDESDDGLNTNAKYSHERLTDETSDSSESNLQFSSESHITPPAPQAPPKATPITPLNRNQYIADGSHYELLSTLSQEAAHDIMRRTFHLDWVTLCDDEAHHEHVRALVDADHPLALEEREVVEELLGVHVNDVHEDEKKEKDESPEKLSDDRPKSSSTLLIATGRGKVRAGIFSRFHLLTAGIEVGTSWHNIREARIRGMGVVIIDPNARGEQAGMDTFQRSVIGLFSKAADRVRSGTFRKHEHDIRGQSSYHHSSSIYILAHSASGGQLVRHLREDSSLLPAIKAIAFTDSTHNIQWCKNDPSLMQFLSTQNCIYLRSNDVRTSQSCIHVSSRGKDIACQCVNCEDNRKSAGVEADSDSFWVHRFGTIRTLWAGTADHALSNWAGHDHIWSHFDRHTVKGKDGED